MRFPCDGAIQDECGTYTCRLDPEDPSFDCDNCIHRAAWERWAERQADAKAEEQMAEDRKEGWG